MLKGLLLTSALLAATPASAVLILDTSWNGGSPAFNDCSGEFGQGFDNCAFNDSPIIAKWDKDENVWEINSIFDSIDGGEFTITLPTGTDNGVWSYNQGVDDPDVRYWVAKGGNSGFNLFYEVSADKGTYCEANPTDCYDDALVVNAGEFWLPINSGSGKPAGLSHISFYDTGDGGGNPPSGIPEPGVVALFGMGLLGMGLSHLRRRRKVS
ncbi:MAG: hypothetical protein DRQ44_09935 [Gammaproteobacteria bacterium]|nr:MAG: hypothetical protein DRQ44_09935 [Gammaproteobacteria bacterium]